ncbi:MAG: DUF421 domain-containing protein [bacterium]
MEQTLVVVIRSCIAYITLMIFTRLLGKQQISQLTFFDYVLGITIGSTASTLTTDLDSRAWPHWVGIFVWSFLVFFTQWITVKSQWFSKYLDGDPVVLIANGQILESSMKRMRYRLSDLLEQLRSQGVFDISEVEFAVLEVSGQISILKKTQYLPLTPQDMKLKTDYQGLSAQIIYDGVLIEPNLAKLNLSRSWLNKQLKKQGVHDVSEVFLASLNTKGELYLDLYRDKVDKQVLRDDFA